MLTSNILSRPAVIKLIQNQKKNRNLSGLITHGICSNIKVVKYFPCNPWNIVINKIKTTLPTNKEYARFEKIPICIRVSGIKFKYPIVENQTIRVVAIPCIVALFSIGSKPPDFFLTINIDAIIAAANISIFGNPK